MDYAVSVIIPVHNSECTMKRAIESLLNQKDITIEIILVENSSNDNSLYICREYECRYENIKVITSKKANVSHARNMGIQYASGEYIGFLDSDDYAGDRMFYSLYKGAEEIKAEVSMCEYTIEKGEAIEEINTLIKVCEEQRIYAKPHKLAMAILGPKEKNERTIMGSVWRCLYQRAFLDKYDFKFAEELAIGEDLLFNLEVLKKATKIFLCPTPFYHYVYNINSATALITTSTWEKYELLFKKLYYYGQKEKEKEDYNIRLSFRIHSFSSWIALEYSKLDLSLKKRYQLIKKVGKSRKRLLSRMPVYFTSIGFIDFMLGSKLYSIILAIGCMVKIKNFRKKRRMI